MAPRLPGPRSRRPVLVLPGFGASDVSTAALRSQLRLLGYPVHRWGLGRNEGPTSAILTGLRDRFDDLTARYDRPIALVGWSLGGVYALAIAHRRPDRVRGVITLGSPLRMTEQGADLPDVPVTSIWSREDSVVPWQASYLEPGHRTENIEVRSSHLTLGFDPLVTVAVADRLRQRRNRWRSFEPPWWLAGAYPRGDDGSAGA